MAEEAFSVTNATWKEGRLENAQERKKQIQKIHLAVRLHVVSLADALQKDGRKETEALLEIHTLLQKLQEIFNHLDLAKSLSTEQRPENGKNDWSRRQGLGPILILSDRKLPLAQSLIPLALAIAAGNTAVVLLSPQVSCVSAELQKIYKSSGLDQEAVRLLQPSFENEKETLLTSLGALPFGGIVIQSQRDVDLVTQKQFLRINPEVRLVHGVCRGWPTIVTRNSDVKRAGADIAKAKFSVISGSAPASPNVVLVDEFVLADFCSSVIDSTEDKSQKLKTHHAQIDGIHEQAENMSDEETAFMRSGGRIINVNACKMLVGRPEWRDIEPFSAVIKSVDTTRGTSTPVLPVLPVTSMEAASSIVANLDASHERSGLYIFSNASEARYLSLLLPSGSTFVNHIPLSNLFLPLPILPLDTSISLYSKPCPVYSSPQRDSFPQHIWNLPSHSLAHSLKALIEAENLSPPKQKSGFQVGFFEQGTRVGFSHLLALLGVTAGSLWWSLRHFS